MQKGVWNTQNRFFVDTGRAYQKKGPFTGTAGGGMMAGERAWRGERVPSPALTARQTSSSAKGSDRSDKSSSAGCGRRALLEGAVVAAGFGLFTAFAEGGAGAPFCAGRRAGVEPAETAAGRAGRSG